MALSIYISNHIPSLAEAMIEDLNLQKGNVFNPHYIITQTQGMNNWLKFQIAEQLGIAANISFLKPAEIVWKTYDILGGTYADKISRQHLDWLIFSILSSHTFQTNYKRQANYFIDNGERDEMKQWEFAAKIADLFDQYQIYRSPLIQAWNTSDLNSIDDENKWQAFIWKELKRKTGNAVMDITEVQTAILNGLKDENNSIKLKQKLPTLYLFGLSIVTPFHLEIFYTLSQYIDVMWYMSNPAPENFWYEDQNEEQVFLKKMQGKNIAHINIGNSLLTSWGKVLQNTFRMLFKTEEFINAVMDLPSQAPNKNTLLGTIQNDLFENKTDITPLNPALLNDKSINITSNYSMRREVETVYNFILEAILQQTYGNITERDIIVMVSDINAYAPFIRAVMDNAPYTFQYSIADESISTGDTIITALIALLEIPGNIFSAESVLQLLNYEHIRTKFGIYNTDLIRQVVKQASIHFGIENDYKTAEDDTYLVSWKYGLQKIMYGLCMADELMMEQEKTFYTLESVDAIGDMQQIIAFTALVNALMENIKQRNTAKTLNEWKIYIEDILQQFLLNDDQDKDEYYTEIIQKFKQNDVIDAYLNNETISYDVFSKRLISGLSNEVFQAKFLSRGITFCSPLPFRSIPFKVVAILGLNYNSFPRKEQHLDFDIMAKSPQLGDRNIKNNDKHLFLESILSAEKAVYLSYIGRSTKDNKPLPPSILIDELLDYIQSAYTTQGIDIRKHLVQEHPLHSYSLQYNQSNNKHLIANYFIQNASQWPLPLKAEESIIKKQEEYSIANVWKFYDKSINYYYNNVLQIYFEQEENEIESTEKFALDQLENWSVKHLLSMALLENNVDTITNKLYSNAMLPLKNVGKSILQNVETSLMPMIDLFKEDKLDSFNSIAIPIVYHYKEISFQGKVADIYDNKLIAFHLGKEDKLYKTKANKILHFLFAKVQNPSIEQVIIYCNTDRIKSKPISLNEASAYLNQLLDVFIQYNDEPVMYSLSTHSDKMNDESFLKYLELNVKSLAKYNEYAAHAIDIIDIATQEKYFEKINPIINQIFFELYEQ